MYVSQLFSATKGSAGLDLASSKDYELTEIHKVYLIGTNVYGPLPKGLVGLMIGRSSVTLKGLNVHIGVIDSDYLGEIKILVSAGSYSVITTGQRLAQLLLLPYTVPQSHQTSRGKEGFGSTNVLDVYWSTSISQQKPLCTLTMMGKEFEGMIDTGADMSVISAQLWPENWPVQTSSVGVQGIGYAPNPLQSSQYIPCKGETGQVAYFKPLILNIPYNLWGRDLLQQWGATLHVQNF